MGQRGRGGREEERGRGGREEEGGGGREEGEREGEVEGGHCKVIKKDISSNALEGVVIMYSCCCRSAYAIA